MQNQGGWGAPMGPRYGMQQQMQYGGGFATSFSGMQGGGFRSSFGQSNFSQPGGGMRGGSSGMRGGRGGGGGTRGSGPAGSKPADSAAKAEQSGVVPGPSASGSVSEKPSATANKPEEPVPSATTTASPANPAAVGVGTTPPAVKVEVSLIWKITKCQICFHIRQYGKCYG